MKTIISSTGNTNDAEFELRFGRAAWFCLLDEETGDTRFIENKHKNDTHGAGPKVVEMLMEMGVSRVITGDFGTKTKEMLDKSNIQMILVSDDSQSIADIIRSMK